jgi:hypothetical protein
MGFEPLRENESIPFFRLNQVATPARITSFNPTGGKAQPTVEKDYMSDTGIGKKTDERDPELQVYLPNKYNLS